jgi:CheY-like chemotaxis protein
VPVLIIDPDKKTGELARNVIHWIDRRIRVEMAEDGAHAWTKALEHRPYMVMCELDLPDIAGDILCNRLVEHLPKTTFIGYSGQETSRPAGPFHGFLTKPPDRFAVLAAISGANQRKNIPLKEDISNAGIYKRERSPALPEINIVVSILDDELSFGIAVPEGATIGMAMRQIGKTRINWFELIRGGAITKSAPQTVLREGDALRIRQ